MFSFGFDIPKIYKVDKVVVSVMFEKGRERLKWVFLYVFFIYVSTFCTTVSQEDAIIEVFKRHRMFYPVEITHREDPPLQNIPWIRPTDFIRTMGEMNDLTHILGGKSLKDAEHTLVDFWSKYRAICPSHQMWDDIDQGRKATKQCVPLFLHGDEGTTYKKGGVFVLSFQGSIGQGTTKTAKGFGFMCFL